MDNQENNQENISYSHQNIQEIKARLAVVHNMAKSLIQLNLDNLETKVGLEVIRVTTSHCLRIITDKPKFDPF